MPRAATRYESRQPRRRPILACNVDHQTALVQHQLPTAPAETTDRVASCTAAKAYWQCLKFGEMKYEVGDFVLARLPKRSKSSAALKLSRLGIGTSTKRNVAGISHITILLC